MKKIVWMTAWAMIAVMGQACVYTESDDIPPRGTDTKTYQLQNFEGLEMGSAFRVHVVAGNTFSVKATGEGNDLDDLDIFVREGKLVARYNRSWPSRRERMDIDITMPILREVDFSGAVRADISGFDQQQPLEIDLSGASELDFEGSVRTFDVDLAGASRLDLFGTGTFLEAELSGASEMHAFDLQLLDLDVELSGASKANVNVSQRLVVEASGASHLRYRGTPVVSQKTSGGSSVRKD